MSIVCARFSDKQLNVICTIYGKGGCAFYVSTQEKLEVFLLFF